MGREKNETTAIASLWPWLYRCIPLFLDLPRLIMLARLRHVASASSASSASCFKHTQATNGMVSSLWPSHKPLAWRKHCAGRMDKTPKTLSSRCHHPCPEHPVSPSSSWPRTLSWRWCPQAPQPHHFPRSLPDEPQTPKDSSSRQSGRSMVQ